MALEDTPGRISPAQAAQQAIDRLPLRMMNETDRADVLAVLSNVTIYHQMPIRTIECSPEFYRFLVEHPDVIVAVWQILGITQLEVAVDEDSVFHINDHQGTTAVARFMYRSPGLHVIYTEGAYDGALLPKPVRGRTLLLLNSSYIRDAEGRSLVMCRLEVFMQVERKGVALLAKALYPLVAGMAETNYTQTVGFLNWLNRAAREKPGAMLRLATSLEGISDETRQSFSNYLSAIALPAAPERANVQTAEADTDLPLPIETLPQAHVTRDSTPSAEPPSVEFRLRVIPDAAERPNRDTIER
ncbi:hypothetical protein JCM19992_09850 [Thermostilla marina]